MSLPSPPADHLRLTTNFVDPHSITQTAYQPTYEPNPSFEADRSLLTNDIKPADLVKARLKDFDHRIHSLPAYTQMKRLRLFSRFLSACLNVFMFSAMVFTITIFISTRHTQVDGRGLWPANPETWPTYLLLSGAIVTLLVSISVLIFYCIRYEQAVRSWKVVMVMVGCEVLVWVIITTLYRVEKKRGDLWGWSCLQIARDLEHDLTGHKNANFHTLCKIQNASWIVSLVETITKFVVVGALFLLRRKLKKETHHQKGGMIELGGNEAVDLLQNFGF